MYTFFINIFVLGFLSMTSWSDVASVQEQLWKGEAVVDKMEIRAEQIPYEIFSRHEGLPYIVLIHDAGADRNSWWHAVQWLTHEYQVIVYDQRGHGDSKVLSNNYSSTTLAKDLLVLLDHLKIPTVHIVGNSLGGRTAIRFAQMFPDRVLSIVVEDMHMMGAKKLLRDYSKVNDVSPVEGISSEPRVFHMYHNQALQEDMTEALKGVTKPMLFLAADVKPTLNSAGVKHIIETNPNARVVVVPNAEHVAHASQFKAFLNLTVDHMHQSEGSYKYYMRPTCHDIFIKH